MMSSIMVNWLNSTTRSPWWGEKPSLPASRQPAVVGSERTSLPSCLYLLFQRGQQLPEEAELPRVEDELGVQLIGADGGVLLAQPVQLEVRHGFHVFSNQSGVGVEVTRLLRTRAEKKQVRRQVGLPDPREREERAERGPTFSMSLLMAFSFSVV